MAKEEPLNYYFKGWTYLGHFTANFSKILHVYEELSLSNKFNNTEKTYPSVVITL